MAKNKIGDLRDHLFETLEALKDPDKPLDVARAKAISDVAKTIIETAKVEIAFAKAIDASSPGTKFFDVAEQPLQPRLAEGRGAGHKTNGAV